MSLPITYSAIAARVLTLFAIAWHLIGKPKTEDEEEKINLSYLLMFAQRAKWEDKLIVQRQGGRSLGVTLNMSCNPSADHHHHAIDGRPEEKEEVCK